MCLICQHFEGTFIGFQKLALGNEGCQGDSIFGTCPQNDFPDCNNEKERVASLSQSWILLAERNMMLACHWSIFISVFWLS